MKLTFLSCPTSVNENRFQSQYLTYLGLIKDVKKYDIDNGFHYNKGMKNVYLAISALIAALWLAFPPSGFATTLTLGTESASEFEKAEIVSSPKPIIPAELHEHCFKSCCIAKFLIHEDGKTNVHIVSSSGSMEVDELTLDTLRKWQFKPAMLDGKPVESSRKVRIEFEVE
jgi:TonB family protein